MFCHTCLDFHCPGGVVQGGPGGGGEGGQSHLQPHPDVCSVSLPAEVLQTTHYPTFTCTFTLNLLHNTLSPLLSVYHSPSQDCVWQQHQLSLASAGPHHRHRARLLHLGRDQPHQPPQEWHHHHQRAPGGRGHRAGQGAGAEGAGAGGGKWWSRSSRG